MKTNRLYRSRNGVILGVCRGVAEYFDISVKWTRILTVVTMIFTGFFPVAFFYVLSAFIMKPTPRDFFEDEPSNPYSHDLKRLKSRFNRLSNRVKKETDAALNREKNWEERLSA